MNTVRTGPLAAATACPTGSIIRETTGRYAVAGLPCTYASLRRALAACDARHVEPVVEIEVVTEAQS